MTNIAILDYGVGNLFSIQTALNKLMVNTILTSKLNTNQKRGVKRRVDLEQGVRPPNSRVFVSKKIYCMNL